MFYIVKTNFTKFCFMKFCLNFEISTVKGVYGNLYIMCNQWLTHAYMETYSTYLKRSPTKQKVKNAFFSKKFKNS